MYGDRRQFPPQPRRLPCPRTIDQPHRRYRCHSDVWYVRTCYCCRQPPGRRFFLIVLNSDWQVCSAHSFYLEITIFQIYYILLVNYMYTVLFTNIRCSATKYELHGDMRRERQKWQSIYQLINADSEYSNHGQVV